MIKQVDATCPECGAAKLNVSLVHEAKVVSLAGSQLKLGLTEVPQLWCNATVFDNPDGWLNMCNWEQSGKIDNDGYAVFGKLEKNEDR
jgi:hypothetical protein